jgi:hypothetical protein
LGKKAYLDVLEDGKGTQGYHIRMKGVPEKALRAVCKGEVLQLYEEMAYFDQSVTFDLTVLPCFQKTKDYRMCNRDHFSRTVCFRGIVHEFTEDDQV